MNGNNALMPFLAQQGVVILDGALATELERRGADLRDPLWSAKLLLEDPALIRQVHYDYLVAGADVVTTASYQASLPGLARRGLDDRQAADILRLSVQLADEARATFWADPTRRVGRLRPLVAASVGPYGAYLADGSEYTGAYGVEVAELMAFHRPRLAVLAASGADLLACETIPAWEEAVALTRLLAEFPAVQAWMSFSCRDDQHVADGTPFMDAVAVAAACPQVVAVGVNCTAPRWIHGLVAAATRVTEKPIVAYPNRGEGWDAMAKCWIEDAAASGWVGQAAAWAAAGARLLGGCCRTTPEEIAVLAAELRGLVG